MSIYRGPLIIGDIPQLDVVVPNFNVTEIFNEGTYDTSVFTLSGAYRIDTTDKFEGTHSLRSALISHSQSTDLYIKFQGSVGDTLRFYYKVSSEGGCDFMQIWLNDVTVVSQISGSGTWLQTDVLNLINGENTIRMRYWKDGSVNNGNDSGFIDKIQIFR